MTRIGVVCALIAALGCGSSHTAMDHDGGDTPVDAGPAPIERDAGPVATDGGGLVCEGDERRTSLVYYGTLEPTAMPLTAGQILAIGSLSGCTGTFINDNWVLTAKHCRARTGARFCVGANPASPNICFQAVEVRDHPSQDMTLLRVDAPASSRAPTLEPIPINTVMLDNTWIGVTAEAAGYGQQENGRSGERKFTAQPIDGFERPEFVVINGEGTRGVCFGDSGGPVMILAADGTIRVAGALSWGDPSCVGRDRYSRTDIAVTWIESFTGPTVVEGGRCGTLTAEGRCVGNTAVYCQDDMLVSDRCSGACGWSGADEGYRCIEGADPCGGLDASGACEGNVARWCERGQIRQRDCGSCGEVCGNVPEVGGAYCRPDACAGLDYLGRCDGDTAVWCDENGTVQQRDCARRGLRCDFVNDSIGYFCTR
ncbi:MAG: trypsin-like serine protease [Myxococcales bacterium]|nr:trypsin-like serine protease [Myxococcales bacterium]